VVEGPGQCAVGPGDFLVAMRRVGPSIVRGLEVDVPHTRWAGSSPLPAHHHCMLHKVCNTTCVTHHTHYTHCKWLWRIIASSLTSVVAFFSRAFCGTSFVACCPYVFCISGGAASFLTPTGTTRTTVSTPQHGH
jgi:hypothetical protein